MVSPVVFTFNQQNSVLEFSIPLGTIEPVNLPDVVADMPKIFGKFCIISGRGPVWLFAAMIAEVKNNVSVLATYDPKLDGAVVVHSIAKDWRAGDVIPFAQPVSQAG